MTRGKKSDHVLYKNIGLKNKTTSVVRDDKSQIMDVCGRVFFVLRIVAVM